MSVQDHHYKQGPMFGCSDSRCCGVMEPEDGDHCPTCWEYWPCEVELLRQRAETAEAKLAEVEAERDAQDAAASYWYGKWVAATAGAWCGLSPAERCVNCGKTLAEHVRPQGVSCYEREEDNRGE